MAEFSVKFVSQKISKIRWKKQYGTRSIPSTMFVTGSWGEYQNRISLWKLEDKVGPSDEDGSMEMALEHEPEKVFEMSHPADVLDIQYASPDVFAVASADGSLTLMKHQPNIQAINTVYTWQNRHHLTNGAPTPCTCIAARGDDWIASGGEDGTLSIVEIGHKEPIHTLENVDSCSINALAFLKQTEIITVNSFGQLKTYDLRQDTKKPAQFFSVTESHTPLLCVDKHPGQAHIIATGGEDGMLTIWDLRQDKFPMTLLEAHTGPMSEVKFHPFNPFHLFTCSNDGSLWHWDGSSFSSSSPAVSAFGDAKGKAVSAASHHEPASSSPWLTLETARHKLDIASLLPNKSLPVNSLDIDSSTLLCGTDSETIYSIKLPVLG